MQSIAIATSVLKSTQICSKNIAMFHSENLCDYRDVYFMVFQCEGSGLCPFSYWFIAFFSINTELLFLLVFLTVVVSVLSFVLQHQACGNDDLHSCNLA